MRLRTDEIARVVAGAHRGPVVDVDGAAIDSRALSGGELFVPVVAERDGHDFVEDALAAGAGAYLTSRAPGEGTSITVDDTQASLAVLGAHARDRLADGLADRVIGITGSVGKTSVKDLVAGALGAGLRVAASKRSFNNELGVPLTLLNAPDDTEALAIELGARGRGHIARLCAVCRPTVGVLTVVAMAHAETFGTIAEVAAAKGELVESLPRTGTAVLNADDALVAAMAGRTDARVLTYGRGLDADVAGDVAGDVGADVGADHVVLDAELRPRFVLRTPWGRAEVRLSVHGEHMVTNALAAAAAALACGVAVEAVAHGLGTASLSPWRMDLRRAPSGALVLNDAYNANPTSMAAALRALARLGAGSGRRVAVLGTMAELGVSSAEAHRGVAALAESLGTEVIAVDTAAYGVHPVEGLDGARAVLGGLGLGPGDAVLVKASRAVGLERLVESLLAAAPT